MPESDSRSAPARPGAKPAHDNWPAVNAHVVRGTRDNGVTRNEMRDGLSQAEGRNLRPVSVYAYGVARNRLEQAARRLAVPLLLTDDFGDAEAIVTLKTHYRRRPRLISDGEKRGLSIYVLRANTVTQMENFLVDLFRLNGRKEADVFGNALHEAEQAISRIRAGEDYIELKPQASQVRKRQHQLARQAHLQSASVGAEPRRYVTIYRGA